MSGVPFHRCTHTALSPRGDIYVSDGYGNACVHKFAPDGKLLKSWGEAGPTSGQFNIVHNIVTDPEGWCTSPTVRTTACRCSTATEDTRRSGSTCTALRPLLAARGKPQFVIGELGSSMPITRQHPNIGPRLSFVDEKGRLLARLGGESGPGLEPGKFIAPHGLAIDSRGDIYVGEVSYTEFPRLFPDQKIAWRMRSLQKLERLSEDHNF